MTIGLDSEREAVSGDRADTFSAATCDQWAVSGINARLASIGLGEML